MHQAAAKQLRARLSRRQCAEHHLKQTPQVVKAASGREHITGIIRNQGVLAQSRHVQSADRHTIAADFHIRAGDLIVHNARVVYQKITCLNNYLFVVNQVLARPAANEDQLNKVLMRVHYARVRARVRSNLADIEQLWFVLSDKNRLYLSLHKALYIQTSFLCHIPLSSASQQPLEIPLMLL